MLPPMINVWDTFPLHPQPHPGEALSSYLGRLMALNEIHDKRPMLSLCFPDMHWRQIVDHLDYGNVPLQTLASLTGYSETMLTTTTYTRLVTRFGFDPQDRSSILFLRPGMMQTLQFCPQCIVDHPWYILAWRFTSVRGCIHHNCRLINICRRCHTSFPLLYSFDQPGICLRCGLDHRKLASPSLSIEEYKEISRYIYDLQYLLRPMDENEPEPKVTLHTADTRLARRRQAIGLSEADIIPFLFDRLRGRHVLEERRWNSRLSSVKRYFAYAYFLGLTISELFDPLDRTVLSNITQGKRSIGDITRHAIKLIDDEERTITNSRQPWKQPTESPVLKLRNGKIVLSMPGVPTVHVSCSDFGIIW